MVLNFLQYLSLCEILFLATLVREREKERDKENNFLNLNFTYLYMKIIYNGF